MIEEYQNHPSRQTHSKRIIPTHQNSYHITKYVTTTKEERVGVKMNTSRSSSSSLVNLIYPVLMMTLSVLASITRGVSDEPPLPLINEDVLGLIVLKSYLHDPTSQLSSWTEDEDSPCSWKCIECDPSTARVTSVSLDSLRLSGSIASAARALGSLHHLKLLSMSNNNLSGTITPKMVALLPTTLRALNLSRNALSGPIPSALIFSSSIHFLDLSHNSLSGPLSLLSSGEDMDIDSSSSSNTSSSSSSSSSSTLRVLSLASNALEGTFPAKAMPASLSVLNLSRNHFSGELDFSSIYSLAKLRTLDVSHNAFSGPVPQGVSRLHFIKELNLRGNQFSGPLPADLQHCPHLKALDISDNLFSGDFPQLWVWSTTTSASSNVLYNSSTNSSNLQFLDCSGNRFTGSLPASMGYALKWLQFLSLSSNNLAGEIPESLHNCEQLTVLRLKGNRFNGSIPNGLFDLGLEELDLSENQLGGSIPTGSARLLRSISTLDLSKNRLIGSIPAEFGLFSSLTNLNLSWNSNLQSQIPPGFGSLRHLTTLDLHSTGIYGSIPQDMCASGSLAILQLDSNSLSGPIPEGMGNCSSLSLLRLSHNNLSGPIPHSISMLSKLRILELQFNMLSGDIPLELGKLDNLLAVNISYNRLTGRLPDGSIFQSLDQSALEGNLGICSPLLKGPCKMDAPKPLVLDPYMSGFGRPVHDHRNGGNEPPKGHTPVNFPHRQFLSVSVIVAISAAIIIALGVMFVSLLNVSARRRPAFLTSALESMRSSSSSTRSADMATGRLILFESKSSNDWVIPESALLEEAFEIGRGVLGTVYKVLLGEGGEGETVAVKRLFPSNIIQHPEDFDREVRILGKAKHPNLISVRGYQWTPQMQILVSDYATNGSLQAKLHERPPSAPPLSWAIRFKILGGIAKGLAHLHHSFRPPIIHYSIKPRNILLDEHYNPKISDFGLTLLVTKCHSQMVRTRFKSTLGYAAPELACQSLRLNEKCDVYGFGVIILEIVTGRRPVEYGEDKIVILCDHVRVLLEQGNGLDCVDSSMGDIPEEEVLPILKLGVVCTSQIPSSRPSMAEVLQILQVIKTPVRQRMEMV